MGDEEEKGMGAVPEGAAHESSSAALREGVSRVRGQSVRAGDISSLDMLVELDEPEQVIRELKKLADDRAGERWAIVAQACEKAGLEYELLHGAPKRAADGESSEKR